MAICVNWILTGCMFEMNHSRNTVVREFSGIGAIVIRHHHYIRVRCWRRHHTSGTRVTTPHRSDRLCSPQSANNGQCRSSRSEVGPSLPLKRMKNLFLAASLLVLLLVNIGGVESGTCHDKHCFRDMDCGRRRYCDRNHCPWRCERFRSKREITLQDIVNQEWEVDFTMFMQDTIISSIIEAC